jgi:outer membrane protein OmpA-like peptidoglycan-associated protein
MSRSGAERGALLAALVVGLLLAPQDIGAQPPPLAPSVLDIRLPVLDLELTSSSLDDSVQTAESEREVRLTLAADVLFRFNKASLTPKARSRLEEVTGRIRSAKPSTVRVEGYTDSKGSDAYNRRLSRRRADAVAGALEQRLGGSAPSLRPVGNGEADPVAANETKDGEDNPRGRAKNRRVTVSFGR